MGEEIGIYLSNIGSENSRILRTRFLKASHRKTSNKWSIIVDGPILKTIICFVWSIKKKMIFEYLPIYLVSFQLLRLRLQNHFGESDFLIALLLF